MIAEADIAEYLRKMLAVEIPADCTHCGRQLAVGGSGYLDGEEWFTSHRMPCDPPYIDCCHQPFSNPDWGHRNQPPLMRKVCAGTWRFLRELPDGREVFRCRRCDDVLVVTPVFSQAGLARMRERLATLDPAEPFDPAYHSQNDHAYFTERIADVEQELAGRPSLYLGPKSRTPR